ncbi:hypothetical protein QQZ08_003863 [Neonectria magnoliae]|uniref:Uncharacterized protein n=1 Tax=Neonectria magnoliae TaxID=2732573 RepID=A0ABR1I7T7_9HYPO
MGAKSVERIARIGDLAMNHQDNVHKIDLVNKDEDSRRLKLRVLSLRDENALLKDKVAQRDSRLSLLGRKGDDVLAELEEARENAKLQDAKLKKQANELAALKTELESLNGSMQDSSKALQEKYALDRELNRIRPEIEHLKSQLTNHQAVVAEKHDLERQLNTLEVELQNEKRYKQRIQQKSDAESSEDWKTRLAAVEKKHASEKKEWEKLKKEHERDLREVQGQSERLEERVLTIKLKFKSVQSELKDAREEVERCHAELEAIRKAPRKVSDQPKKMVTMKPPASRKRRVNEMSLEDISIGTPGPDETTNKRASKKRGAEHALVGEKSTFSVTPFLNRTKNLSDESIDLLSPTSKPAGFPEAVIEDEDVDEDEDEQAEVTAPRFEPQETEESTEAALVEVETKKAPSSKQQKPRGRPRKALDDASTLKKNMPSSSVPKKQTSQAHSKLEKVTEEAEEVEQDNGAVKKAKKGPELNVKGIEARTGNSVPEADGGKKKRKMLGGSNKTLFDDDEVEMLPKPVKVLKAQLGAGRRLKVPLGGAANAFGGRTFSPLKRDRRGVNASFLA